MYFARLPGTTAKCRGLTEAAGGMPGIARHEPAARPEMTRPDLGPQARRYTGDVAGSGCFIAHTDEHSITVAAPMWFND